MEINQRAKNRYFKIGYWEEYYRNGQLMWKGYYDNGRKTGYWEEYWVTHKLYGNGKYKNDSRYGYWIWNNENNLLSRKDFYFN